MGFTVDWYNSVELMQVHHPHTIKWKHNKLSKTKKMEEDHKQR